MATREDYLHYDSILPPRDKLGLHKDELLMKEFEPDERIMFAIEVVKINYRNNYQNRFIAVTTKNIYNLKAQNAVSRLFSKKKVIIRQKFPIGKVSRVVYSNSSDQFIIGHKTYDLVYESPHRNDIIEYLMRAIDLWRPNLSVEFYFVEDYGMNELANHESRVAVRKPDTEAMNLTFLEYMYHFLGKKKATPLTNSTRPFEEGQGTQNRFKVGTKDFRFVRVVGTGGFSKVYLVKHRGTKEFFAMKAIKVPPMKSSKDKQSFLQQVKYEKQILMQLKHPFIVKLKYAFYEKRRFFLVMGLVQGGEFLPFLKTIEKKKKEEVTKFYAAQIAMALNYVHVKGIVYGDLKPENILVDNCGYLKMTDFGASRCLNGKRYIDAFAGTPDYLAPEVLKSKQITRMSDWWTFGILIYEMLYGKSPFIHENPSLMYGKILEEEPVFPKEFKYSEESTDLIKKLLKKNGSERLGIDDEQEIFTHPWFNEIDFAKLISKRLPAIIIPHVDEVSPLQDAETGEQAPELQLSFDLEDKKLSKAEKKPATEAAEEAGFDDFSYFEEEDFVETPCHDDLKILDPEFEEERRVQLLTNIEERSMRSEDEACPRDALHSPRHAGDDKPSKTKEPESDDKMTRRKASIGDMDLVKRHSTEADKIERKGSGSTMTVNTKKPNSSLGEISITDQPDSKSKVQQAKKDPVVKKEASPLPSPVCPSQP